MTVVTSKGAEVVMLGGVMQDRVKGVLDVRMVKEWEG